MGWRISHNVKGPVIFAANHQSHMDVPVILAALPGQWRRRVATAMAKEFFKAHFFPEGYTRGKRLARSLEYYLSAAFFNTFPLPQREAGARQTLRYTGELLSSGFSVLIFPGRQADRPWRNRAVSTRRRDDGLAVESPGDSCATGGRRSRTSSHVEDGHARSRARRFRRADAANWRGLRGLNRTSGSRGAKIGRLGGVCGTIIASGGYVIAQWTARRRTLLKGFRASLSKDDLIDMQGTVVAVHSGGLYRVQCDAGHEVLAQLSGRMRRFRIKVVPGDRVTVGVSPYDPVRGIITFRAR